jgi:aldose 1-epimerase
MKSALFMIVSSIFVLALLFCANKKESIKMVQRRSFQATRDGKPVDLYTLKNRQGHIAQVTNYGAKLVSLFVPDKNGRLGDVALGYSSLEDYLARTASMGATIGRVANRIAGGQFTLEGQVYTLAKNNGQNSLHGGAKGFRNVVWDAHQPDDRSLELHYLSVDGEEGYPGNLDVQVRYTLTDEAELVIDYIATTDKVTVINLTNHAFFNLAGESQGNVLNHDLQIAADQYTPVDAQSIPTGELLPVAGTPFDFREPHKMGERIHEKNVQLMYGKGYDINFVLNRPKEGLLYAARVHEPMTGRVMEVYTTEPGLQFYTGNNLGEKDLGKSGVIYAPQTGFCLETQHFADSPNKPQFPSVVLRPGDRFQSSTVYKFSVQN